jgi:uncharacterized protein (DUF1800 family)
MDIALANSEIPLMSALEHLAPFLPGKDGPWDAHAAAHLVRRAGFAASKPEIDRAVKEGPAATVDALFTEAPEQENEFQETFSRISGQLLDFSDATQLQTWWIYRMLRTRTPLREKLTLFWHGHFATNYNKVEEVALMHKQCEMLRKLAWGDFRELAQAISRDPAMLIYLDGESNTRENPNENYGRELLELFTLGHGNYTEADVRAAARAFTGWGRDGEKFIFNAEMHDDGPKEFLGQKGNFDGGDIVDAVAKHPATARYIAGKLLKFFACPEPARAAVAEAGEIFTQCGRNIKDFLHHVFLSKYFYSSACRRTRIASPVEYVVGVCRALGARITAGDLRQYLVDMGQELFAPPNVKGWDGEKKWINAAAWAARLAFAQHIAELPQENALGERFDVTPLVPADMSEPPKIVDALAEFLLEGTLPAGKQKELAEFLPMTDEGDKSEQFGQDADFRQQQVKALVGVILSLPEFHAY